MIRALLGGSFDPAHAGHVAVARHLLVHSLADHVVVVPAWRSPWRQMPVAGPEDRLAMCRLAFADLPQASVDDREIAAGRPVFTVETLAALALEEPTARWRLVIGGDHLAGFPQWRQPGRILELAELLVVERAGHGQAGAVAAVAGAAGLTAGRMIIAPPFDHPVSATGIRAMLAHGERPGAMLTPAVAAYIEAHRLYRAD